MIILKIIDNDLNVKNQEIDEDNIIQIYKVITKQLKQLSDTEYKKIPCIIECFIEFIENSEVVQKQLFDNELTETFSIIESTGKLIGWIGDSYFVDNSFKVEDDIEYFDGVIIDSQTYYYPKKSIRKMYYEVN